MCARVRACEWDLFKISIALSHPVFWKSLPLHFRSYRSYPSQGKPPWAPYQVKWFISETPVGVHERTSVKEHLVWHGSWPLKLRNLVSTHSEKMQTESLKNCHMCVFDTSSFNLHTNVHTSMLNLVRTYRNEILSITVQYNYEHFSDCSTYELPVGK